MVGPVAAIAIVSLLTWVFFRRRKTPDRVMSLQEQQAMWAGHNEQNAGFQNFTKPATAGELMGQPVVHELAGHH